MAGARSESDLQQTLQRINGRGYKAYREIEGVYHLPGFTLYIDHVQGDPFAAPSRLRIAVPLQTAGFPQSTRQNRSREIATCDFVARAFARAIQRHSKGNRGIGGSGIIAIDRPGQEILARTSVVFTERCIEARFTLGLPAAGRTVLGHEAAAMLLGELPQIINDSLFFSNLDSQSLYRHIEVNENADVLRTQLEKRKMVAFVADGSVLPRKSGIDPQPLTGTQVVPFHSPDSMKTTFDLPNHGTITGMGITEGITLIAGGGYHGKSTLLNALEVGVYNHIPGDGRELVITNPYAMKIRAEDGRRIEKVDISPFISNLPHGQDTVRFSTEDASGSTSQAANIIESIEAGAQLLLMDEDTSATNFMIRDHRMQELVSHNQEPITPFIDKVRQLYTDLGISTILVLGGSGDYFDVANRVLCMTEYLPFDKTGEALSIAAKYRTERKPEGGATFGTLTERIPLAHSFDAGKGRNPVKIAARGISSIQFGTHTIDLGSIEQIVDVCQTRSIADAIQYATRFMDGSRTLSEILRIMMETISEKGLDILSVRPSGSYAAFRSLELATAINRLRTLEMKL